MGDWSESGSAFDCLCLLAVTCRSHLWRLLSSKSASHGLLSLSYNLI